MMPGAGPRFILRALLLILIIFLHIALSRAQLCNLFRRGPFPQPVLVFTLQNGSASHSLSFRLCRPFQPSPKSIHPNSAILTSSNPSLRPEMKISSTPIISRCTNFDAQIFFHFNLGRADLTLRVFQDCAFTFPVLVAGVAAVAVPSRAHLTAPSAAPLILPPPRYTSSKAFLSVVVVLPTGERLRRVDATQIVTVQPLDNIPCVFIRLATKDRPTTAGNMVVEARSGDSDFPRPPLPFKIVLRVPTISAVATVLARVPALQPAVEAIQGAGKVIPNAGGGFVNFTVSRAGGDIRRLVLLLPRPDNQYHRKLVGELAYEKEGQKYISTVQLPNLGLSVVGDVKWLFEVIYRGRKFTALDRTGRVPLTFGWKPVLNTLFPMRVPVEGPVVMVLLGDFSGSTAGVLLNGASLKNENILSLSETEIVLQVPPMYTKKNGTISVAVRDNSGLISDAVSFVVDDTALKMNAVLLESSYDSRRGRFVLPSCGSGRSPTVLAELDAYGIQEQENGPFYSFSIRNSSTGSDDPRVFSEGGDNIVALPNPDYFQEGEAVADEVVMVFVKVSFAERQGEALLLVSRQLRADKIGVRILSPSNTDCTTESQLIHESRLFLPPDCPHLHTSDVEVIWKINGRNVEEYNEGANVIRPGNGPRVLGIGNRILVPVKGQMRYSLSAYFMSIDNGNPIADGSWQVDVQEKRNNKPLDVILNGRMVSMVVETGKNFTISESVFGACNSKSCLESLRYTWQCVEITAHRSQCPESMLPTAFTRGETNTIEAPKDWRGRKVEYSLQVHDGKRKSKPAVLNVSFLESNADVFPAATLDRNTGHTYATRRGHHVTLMQYEDVILSTEGSQGDAELNFTLYHDGREMDLQSREGDKLISHHGYWTPDKRHGKFLGILGQSLSPGTYRLSGALDKRNVSSSTAASTWEFTVAPTAHLRISTPSVLDGIVNQTVYHVSASSNPASANQFFFSLKPAEGTNDISTSTSGVPTVTDHCLGSCAGLPVESFTVGTPGRFFVVVKMYDPTGSLLLKVEEGTEVITVQDSTSSSTQSSQKNDEPISSMRRSFRQMNEVAFLSSVIELSQQQSAPAEYIQEAVSDLDKISASWMRNQFQSARVINACTSLIRHGRARENIVIPSLLGVVDKCVRRTHDSFGLGKDFKASIARFYGAATDAAFGSPKGDKFNSSHLKTLSDIKASVSKAAAQNLFLALATGSACGAVQALKVSRKPLKLETPEDRECETSLCDNFTVGVECFPGQVRSLLPKFDVELCEEEASSSNSRQNEYSAKIIGAAERYEEAAMRDIPDIMTGPTVFVNVFDLVFDGKPPLLRSANSESGNISFKSRVSVFDVEREGDFGFKDGQEIQCLNAGTLFVCKDEVGVGCELAEAETSKISEFQLHTGGRVSAAVRQEIPATIRMEVNATLIRACVDFSGIAGSRSSNLTSVLVSVMGGVLAFIVVVALIAMYSTPCFVRRESFSVPASAAQVDSFTTSDSPFHTSRGDSSTLHSYDGSGVPNEWEAEYASLGAFVEQDIDSEPEPATDEINSESPGLKTEESDDFSSRGTMQGYERQSLTDIPAIIPWMCKRSFSSVGENKQMSFVGSSSLSSDDYIVLDSFGRNGRPPG